MKREDLEKIEGLSKDAIDKIMALHGQDIEVHKSKLATAQTEIDGLKKQLTEAGTTIEGFKKLDIEGVKKSADEWKTKAEQAQADAQKQIAQLRFDNALDGALTGAKAKNAKAVKALLNAETLKLNEADGSIIGLKEQLEKIQSENDYLFEGNTKTPEIVSKTNNQNVLTDPVIASARKAAGLKTE